MTILIIGIVIFFALHLIPMLPGPKQGLVSRLGENAYKGLFSVGALIGLVLMIWGFARSDYVAVYDPPAWGRHVTMVCVLLAFICLSYFHLKGRIRKAIRHPMLYGIALWSAGHLFANGDLASVLLFGAFLVFSVLDIAVADAQGRIKDFEPKPVHDFVGIGVGVVLFAAVLFLHPYIIGVPVM